MTGDLGIRSKVAGAAAIATVALLSLVGAIGYNALLRAAHQSQVDLLNERLDDLELQLASDDGQLVGRLQLDSGLRVVREGNPIPSNIPQTISVVRGHSDPDIRAIVGLVDTTRLDATFETIRVALWISVAVIGLVVGATAWLVVDRSLAPVRRLTRQAEANMASPTLEPLSQDGGEDEIAELATIFNAMLDRLRGADEDRRRFVSDASHELRTPLMVLGADAEFALDHPATEAGAATELAETVLAQTDRLTMLVDDLLALASLDEDGAPVADAVTVADVVHGADAEPLLGHVLEQVGDALIPDVSRSLANIVANARRHRVEHIEGAVDIEDGVVRFTVDDDGPGVPMHERHQIFKRFYRPDNDRNRRGGGAGLGLAITEAEIVRAGGSVEVGDSPLGGARFVLTVPIRD